MRTQEIAATLQNLEVESVTVACPKTGNKIFTQTAEVLERHRSYGYCEDCKTYYDVSFLKTPTGFAPCAWTVVYSGYVCKSCWENTDTSDMEF